MMMSYNNATKDLLWFARRVQGVVDLIPQLEDLGSIENTTNEARAQLEALQKAAVSVRAEVLEAQQALKDSREAQEATFRETQERVRALEAEHSTALQKARDAAVAETKADLDQLAEERKAVVRSIAGRKNELTKVDQDLQIALARLRDINLQIESLRAKF